MHKIANLLDDIDEMSQQLNVEISSYHPENKLPKEEALAWLHCPCK